MKTLALILAGGRGSRLDILSEHRVKPAVPFAGKYRIIDFTLSNCSNSGIYHIGILTQYHPLSLNEHIGVGKPWDLDRRDTKLTLLQPYKEWYTGTADSVAQNIEYIKRSGAERVLVLSGDHVYKMDYRKMLAEHEKKGAKLTIAVQEVPWEETHRFGIMSTDANGRVTRFREKPEDADSNLASMGIYVFEKDFLISTLQSLEREGLDFGKHVVPSLIGDEVYTHLFDGYWKDVGTYQAYLEANLELTNTVDKIPLDMYDRSWRIFTKSEELPSVKIGSKASINQALISNGSIVAGNVERSVLGPGVVVHPRASIKRSVVMNDTVVEAGALIEDAIIDKNVHVGENARIGTGDASVPNEERPDLLSSGLNVLGKGAHIEASAIIERNCRIFSRRTVKGRITSGSTL